MHRSTPAKIRLPGNRAGGAVRSTKVDLARPSRRGWLSYQWVLGRHKCRYVLGEVPLGCAHLLTLGAGVGGVSAPCLSSTWLVKLEGVVVEKSQVPTVQA